MSFKSIVRGLRDMKVRIGNISRTVAERKHRSNRTVCRIVPDVALSDTVEGRWASLPPKLLMDIIHRLEESEASWPARAVIVCCASVCKSWREITKQIVKTPEECCRLTFPISLKQCFVKRDRAKSVYRLYFGMTPFATVSYEAILEHAPRKMHCAMHSIPFSSIQEVGSAPKPTSLPRSFDEKSSSTPLSKAKDISSTVTAQEPLVLKSKAPWWNEKVQGWCLHFKGRVTVAAVENFQLLAAVDACHNIPVTEQDKVILQFGKIGEDIFTMDYCYPLSAFQAFAICLSAFGPFI
ncbi:hypothetical protein HAX54_026000 [Datura stramonium]|uniref:Uncharacterized protein n=1 Tax=Datura stramonium TaxID=4076 RepID=A0ABS8S6W6_DATST|nr:hypothetical protein [Datura stramonium]